MKGINEEVKIKLKTAEITIFNHTNKCQLVSENFPILCKGLLGAEYFEKSHALLDFGNRFVKVSETYYASKDKRTFNQNNN